MIDVLLTMGAAERDADPAGAFRHGGRPDRDTKQVVLFQGNRDALNGFTEKEASQLVALLTRLIANLDRIASVEES